MRSRGCPHISSTWSGVFPTLRAFNRSGTQVRADRSEPSEEYRRTTMEVLRISFLSGAVLDLTATIATALVAVTLGVRLIGGGIRPRAGAHDPAAHARAVRATPRARDPVPRKRRRLGCGRSHLRPIDATTASGASRRLGPHPCLGVGSARRGPGEACRSRRPGARRPRSGVPTGRDRCADRSKRSREEHHRRPAPRSPVAGRGIGGDRRRAISPRSTSLPGDGSVSWVPQRPTMFRGSVRDNIAIADATRLAGLDRSARHARLRSIGSLAILLRGFDTVIGDGARRLFGRRDDPAGSGEGDAALLAPFDPGRADIWPR